MGVLGKIGYFLVFSFLLLLSFVIFIILRNGKEKIYFDRKEYQFISVNPFTWESSIGSISTSQPIVMNSYGYLSYWEELSGQSMLISNFGEEIYQCGGVCTCEHERRSTSSATLSRSLLFLSSALTSVVAFHRAKQYFDNECLNVMSEVCVDNIRSEVDECALFFRDDGEYFESSSSSGMGKNQPNNFDRGPRRTYYCQGHCALKVPRRKRDLFRDESNSPDEKVGDITDELRLFCRSRYISKEIRLDISSSNELNDKNDNNNDNDEITEKAKKNFNSAFLRSFCEKSTFGEVVEQYDMKTNQFCTSSLKFISCIQTNPKINEYPLEMKNMDMVIRMKQTKVIKKDLTFNTMLEVDRGDFGEGKGLYWDTIIDLYETMFREYERKEDDEEGFDSHYLSPPSYSAFVADTFNDILEREGPVSVLDVGTGSGYTLSIFAHIVCPKGGIVVGIENDPETYELALSSLRKKKKTREWLEEGCIELIQGEAEKVILELDRNFDIVHTGGPIFNIKKGDDKKLDLLSSGGRLLSLHTIDIEDEESLAQFQEENDFGFDEDDVWDGILGYEDEEEEEADPPGFLVLFEKDEDGKVRGRIIPRDEFTMEREYFSGRYLSHE